MSPAKFPESNCKFGPPQDLDEAQVRIIDAYRGVVQRGSMEGSEIVVVAWQPSRDEIEMMLRGFPIYLTCLGGLPPHFLSMEFSTAISPA